MTEGITGCVSLVHRNLKIEKKTLMSDRGDDRSGFVYFLWDKFAPTRLGHKIILVLSQLKIRRKKTKVRANTIENW